MPARRRSSGYAFIVHSGLALLVLVAAGAVAHAEGEVQPEWPRLLEAGHCEGVIVGNGSRGPYALPCPFPVPGTMKVTRNGRLLVPGSGFVVDQATNTLSLRRRLGVGEQVETAYRAFPFRLATVVSELSRDDLLSVDSVSESFHLETVRGGTRIPSTLFITGSKTVGLRLGDGMGPGVEQSLRVTLFGHVTDDIEVNGVLSDQSLPFQPEGTTTELEEIDKVFVEVRGPTFRTLLGDQVLDHEEGEFVRFGRKVSGATGEVRRGSIEMEGSVALSGARFATQSFRGAQLEANQGPYGLVDPETGSASIRILAGSEQVWLDGVPMVRGESKDYVIDYERGEVTFTTRRLITSENEIVVDFEYSADAYRRGLEVARVRGQGSVVEAEFLLYSEKDHLDAPVGMSLDDSDLAALEATGDSAAFARRDGATEVALGEGDYLRSDGDDGEGHFFYAPGEGDWVVTFSEVAGGDYTKEIPVSGPIYFVYAGASEGDHDPVILIPVPTELKVADLRLAAAPGDRIRISAEGALSREDRNLGSQRDDPVVDGAFSLSGDLDPISLPFMGDLSGFARWRRHGKEFKSPGRDLDIETVEKWGLDNALKIEARDRFDAESELKVLPWLGLSAGLGRLNSHGSDVTRRAETGLDVGTAEGGAWADGQWNGVHRSDQGRLLSRYRRMDGRAGYRGAQWEPQIAYQREERLDSLSVDRSYDDFQSSLGWSTSAGSRVSVSQRWRWNDSFDTVDGLRARSRTTSLEGDVDLPAGGNVVFDIAHRLRRAGSEIQATDLVRIEGGVLPPSGIFSWTAAYDFLGGEQRLEQERYVLAIADSLPGEYSYDPETETYYYDPDDGIYARIREETGESSRVLEVGGSMDLRVDPGRAGVEGLAGWFAFDGTLRIRETTRSEAASDVAFLRGLRTVGETLRGSLDARGDLHFRRDDPAWNLRFRMATSHKLDDPGGTSPRVRLTDQQSIRLRSQPSASFLVEIEGGLDHEEEDSSSLNHALTGRFVEGELTGFPGRPVELLLDWELRDTEVVDGGGDSRMAFGKLAPGLRFDLDGRGRMTTEVGFEGLSVDGTGVPISIRRGQEEGMTVRWRAHADYRLSDIVTASAEYSGAVEPVSGTRNRGRIEVRAFF